MKNLTIAVGTLFLFLVAHSTFAEISSGFEGQVRLHSGETFVTLFQTKADTPYLPATPYGYMGYKLASGVSFGLGVGFNYFKYNNTIPQTLTANSGWELLVAPTLQVPFIHSEAYEFYAAARFILGAGSQTLQTVPNDVFTTAPLMSYGGNLGVGGTWYPIGCFGVGAEAGAALNYYNANATTTIAQTVGIPYNINALYAQSYFALTANYVF